MHAVLKSRCSSGPFLIAHQHIALATVAWAGAATDLALYWGGVAVGHWLSVAAVAVAATAWHAALLAMGGPSVFRDCLVFAASASAPVAVYFGSLLGAFLPTLWMAMLAAALPLAALLASFPLCAALRMPAVDAWKKTAKPVAYAAAASVIVVSLGMSSLGDERCLVVGRPVDGIVSSEDAFDAVVHADLAPASQQGLADVYASFAAAEAAHLGIEAPRLVLRFQPFASTVAETEVDGNEVRAEEVVDDPFMDVNPSWKTMGCETTEGAAYEPPEAYGPPSGRFAAFTRGSLPLAARLRAKGRRSRVPCQSMVRNGRASDRAAGTEAVGQTHAARIRTARVSVPSDNARSVGPPVLAFAHLLARNSPKAAPVFGRLSHQRQRHRPGADYPHQEERRAGSHPRRCALTMYMKGGAVSSSYSASVNS